MDSLRLRPAARPQFDLFGADDAVSRLAELEECDARLEFRGRWTDLDVDTLREGLLLRLRWLRDRRVSPQLKQRLLEWLSVPFRPLSEIKHDPFSFQACCLALRVDPEGMRERVLTMCDLEPIGYLRNENTSVQPALLFLDEEMSA
jgi:hypothetical protein